MFDALKGHTMNRGTMMVLKRLLVTALGALGLSALATGPAFSQDATTGDGLPAPKLYGDITSCAGGMLPDSPTAMGTMSVLSMVLADDRVGATADIDATQEATLNGLLNLDACTNPVANGYSQAVAIYNEYNAAKAALPPADADPDPDATARYNAAKAARDAFGGAVYSEVYNQQMQLQSVTDAIDDYNDLVGTGGALAALKSGYDAVVVNDLGTGTEDNLATDDSDDPSWNRIYGSTGVRGYQQIDGTAIGDDLTDDELTAAFDSSGVLQLANTGNNPDLTGSTTVTNLGQIVQQLDKWQSEVDDAQDVLDDAIADGNTNLSPLREDLRRKTNARDHVQGELTRLSSIIRAQNRDITDITIGTGEDERTLASNERELLTAYGTVNGEVDAAAAKVRSAVTALERSNNALQDALASPSDYLDQLVALRQFQKDAADTAVTEAGANVAPVLTTRAEEAQEALDAATAQRDAHAELTGDPDSPASKLLSALLEPAMKDGEVNPGDDDGQAVIDAISATYEVAQGAADAAQDVVDELTADGGAVAMNTERSMKNAADIEGLDGRVTANEETLVDHGMKLMQKKEYIDNLAAEIGVDPVTGEGLMEGGMSRIDYNAMGIVTNAENIAANAGNIVGLRTDVDANTGNIAMNSGRIDTNAANISSNADAIAANMNSIGSNSSAISDNRNMIGSNSSAISDNRNMIGELSDDLDVVRAGVAASMALAGMPAINGRGVSIGVGSFDGESAFAVGFQIQGEMASFKVGVTSASGATGASAGVGFQF